MSFRPTVFSYNATVLLIQPNPTHGWTQPMSISAVRAPGHNAPLNRFFDFGAIAYNYCLLVYIVWFSTYPFLSTFSLLISVLTYLFF